MFEIEVRREFSSAHRLRGYDGNCARLHGHNYTVVAVLRAAELDEIGIAVDFKKLKAALDPLLASYDHCDLSEHPDFQTLNPTSENIARTLYRKLGSELNDGNVKVARISILESAGSCASYYED